MFFLVDEYFIKRLTYTRKRTIVWNSISRYLQKFIDKNSVVLDLGAGYCDFINSIQAKEKYALDISHVIEKYAYHDVYRYVQTCTKLDSFDNEMFDVVFSSNLFEHLTKNEFFDTLSEVSRILKNNGLLIIIQPNYRFCKKDYFEDYTHKTIFTDKTICRYLIKKGFIINKNIPKFLPFSVKSKGPFNELIVDLYLRSPIKPFAKQMLIIAKKL